MFLYKARGDGKIPGNMSENAYENFNHENVYENVKLEVSRRPRAPTPPQVRRFNIFKSSSSHCKSSYVCCITK